MTIPVSFAPPPSGVAATDMANIQAAIASLPSGGGEVRLQAGSYAVASAGRNDSGVTYPASTVASGSNGQTLTQLVTNGLDIVSTTNFPAAGQVIVQTNNGPATLAYSSLTTNTSLNGISIVSGTGTWTVATTDTIVVNGGTWSDTHCAAGDVGSYVLGPIGTRPPKILTVNAGVGFTTDIPPFVNITAGVTVQVVSAAFVIPQGVEIVGTGRFASLNFLATSGVTCATQIVDSGTGVTALILGAQQTSSVTGYGAEYGLRKLSIVGSTSGVAGSTFCGLYVANGAWLVTLDRVDLSWHGTAGLIYDDNMNSLDARSCTFMSNGTSAATSITGGVLTTYYNQATGAALNFYNSFFYNNYGVSVGAALSGYTYGTGAVLLWGCQLVSTKVSAWGASSGSGWAVLMIGGSSVNNICGCWFGTNATGDVWNNGGALTLTSSSYNSTGTYQIYNLGYLTIHGGYSNMTSGNIINLAGGVVSWSGIQSAGAALYSGGPNVQGMYNTGSSAGPGLNHLVSAVSLINGAQTFSTITLPNDGKPHYVVVTGEKVVTGGTSESGGQVQVQSTLNGSAVNTTVQAGGEPAGTYPFTTQAITCDPNTTVSVVQTTAQTAAVTSDKVSCGIAVVI